MLTRSTSTSIMGALWFTFSAFTQWQFSWPSQLPDMVGLCAWIVCLFCYLLSGSDDWMPLVFAALGFVACAVNFAMFAYLPHQIPLIWCAVFIIGSWAAGRVHVLRSPQFWPRRLAIILSAFCLLGAVMFFLYRDIAPTIAVVANTYYPGRRSLGGGGYNLAILGSHFLDLWNTEARYPPSLPNICEASGFIWLAPVTLFCLSRVKRVPGTQKIAFVSLGLFFVWLWSFEILPIPASITRLVFFDIVPPGRALPALGLVNVALVALVLAWPREPVQRSFFQQLTQGAAIFALILAVIGLVNVSFGNFYSFQAISVTSLLLTLAVKFLLDGRTFWFGTAVVIPSVLVFSGVNPVQRGFDTVFRSDLFRFVHSRPALLNGKWLVFSPDIAPSGFFSAVGCDVFTGMKYVPDLKDLGVFDPTGENFAKFNRAGYLLASLAANSSSNDFEQNGIVVTWKVNPLDPRLRQVGIRYVAFQSEPPQDIKRSLAPLTSNPVSTFWIYELQEKASAPDTIPEKVQSMARTGTASRFYVDMIGTALNPIAGAEIAVSAHVPLTVNGWAAEVAGDSPSGVEITIDQRGYPAIYGLARTDVAQLFKNPAYTASGFTLRIPASELSTGQHTLAVRIINRAGTAYFESPVYPIRVQ
ncbi:MAG: hypothetical protein JO307_33395 [Bryobacterales bacterium]|nr:hypothetical protein [Bryobacterales bacterium]